MWLLEQKEPDQMKFILFLSLSACFFVKIFCPTLIAKFNEETIKICHDNSISKEYHMWQNLLSGIHHTCPAEKIN